MKKIGNRLFFLLCFDGVWKAIWEYGCEKKRKQLREKKKKKNFDVALLFLEFLW